MHIATYGDGDDVITLYCLTRLVNIHLGLCLKPLQATVAFSGDHMYFREFMYCDTNVGDFCLDNIFVHLILATRGWVRKLEPRPTVEIIKHSYATYVKRLQVALKITHRGVSVMFRSTPPSRPNNIREGLKCSSVGTSVLTTSVQCTCVRPQKVFPISLKVGL